MISLLVALIMLPLILYASLQSTKVQTYLVNHLTEYLSRELETDISVDGVSIRLLRSIVLENVKMKDQQGEPLLEVQRMEVELGKISFNHRRLSIKELHFEDALLNFYKEEKSDNYNFRFLMDYFSDREKTERTGTRWEVICAAFKLTNTAFYHHDENMKPRENGFDAGDFYVSNFNLAMNNILLKDSTLSFGLDYIYYKESSGFLLNHLSGDFSIGPNQTTIDHFIFRSETSDLQLEMVARYESFVSLETFFPSLEYQLNIQAAQLDLADMGHFFPGFYGMKDIIKIEGEFKGMAGDLAANKVNLQYGNNSSFKGGFHLTGMPEWPQSSLDFRVDELHSNMDDITSFHLPADRKQQTLELPDYLFNLGEVSFSGQLKGSLTDLMAEGSMATDIGLLNADIKLHKDAGDALYHYHGTLIMDQFHMGKLFNNDERMGSINMQGVVSGSGFSPDKLELNVDGHITSFNVLGNVYENIQLSGDFLHKKFNGSFLVDDPNLFLDFNGMINFEETVPVFDFMAQIDRANLTRMNVFQRDSLYESTLSANMTINARASSLNDLDGEITIEDIRYVDVPLFISDPFENIPTFSTDSIQIRNTIWSAENKHLRIRSEFLDADLHGNIHFDQLANALRQASYSYIPAFNLKNDHQNKEAEHTQALEFSFRFKETENLTGLFFPGVKISPDSWLNGSFDSSGQNMVIKAHADLLSVLGRRFVDWNLAGNQINDHYKISVNSRKLMLSDSLHMNDFAMETLWGEDQVNLSLHWNGKEHLSGNGGNIQGVARIHDRNYFDFAFQSSRAWVNGDLWEINRDNKIIVNSNRLEIFNLMAYNNDQFFMAEGVLSSDPEDMMTLSFGNFDIAYTELLMGENNFDFGGIMDGYVTFTGFYQPPSIGAEIYVEGFSFNRELMGNLDLQSIWDNDQQAFLVDGAITDEYHGERKKPLVVSGKVYTGDRDHNFDLDIDVTGKKMSVWGRFIQGFAEDVKGWATGHMRLEGPFHSPELSGYIELLDASLHIPYLNVTYRFNHDVEITKDSFRFAEGMMLMDSLGNKAEVSGAILHNTFSDFALDILIRPRQTIIFNTSAANNELYYGTAFLTGQAHLHGPTNDITMNVAARTNRGTRVFLPLNYTGDIRETHYISFVSPDRQKEGSPFVLPDRPGAVTLNFDLEVTPDAEVQLLFDTRFGDIIRGRGDGNLRMEVFPGGAFNIYGDFVIEEGEYFFNLQNIINKRFRIEQGSTIGWTGDLNDADIDLRAAYRLRTSLYDLFIDEGIDAATADHYRRRIPVETMLIMEDKLFDPEISFDINVPGGDEQTREMIERVITTDQEMNRQVFSLLVLNRFMPATADQYNTALGYGVGSTSSELLSNQLSNWLSQISSDFDIGINYRPGDEISSQELELALSTQLFDDRVTIDGNFGMAGNHTATGHRAQDANQIIGDVNVEVMITPEGKFRIKAFNRSNTFDIINTNAPYTQGIGLFYRKEFDRLEELFRRERRSEVNE